MFSRRALFGVAIVGVFCCAVLLLRGAAPEPSAMLKGKSSSSPATPLQALGGARISEGERLLLSECRYDLARLHGREVTLRRTVDTATEQRSRFRIRAETHHEGTLVRLESLNQAPGLHATVLSDGSMSDYAAGNLPDLLAVFPIRFPMGEDEPSSTWTAPVDLASIIHATATAERDWPATALIEFRTRLGGPGGAIVLIAGDSLTTRGDGCQARLTLLAEYDRRRGMILRSLLYFESDHTTLGPEVAIFRIEMELDGEGARNSDLETLLGFRSAIDVSLRRYGIVSEGGAKDPSGGATVIQTDRGAFPRLDPHGVIDHALRYLANTQCDEGLIAFDVLEANLLDQGTEFYVAVVEAALEIEDARRRGGVLSLIYRAYGRMPADVDRDRDFLEMLLSRCTNDDAPSVFSHAVSSILQGKGRGRAASAGNVQMVMDLIERESHATLRKRFYLELSHSLVSGSTIEGDRVKTVRPDLRPEQMSRLRREYRDLVTNPSDEWDFGRAVDALVTLGDEESLVLVASLYDPEVGLSSNNQRILNDLLVQLHLLPEADANRLLGEALADMMASEWDLHLRVLESLSMKFHPNREVADRLRALMHDGRLDSHAAAKRRVEHVLSNDR